MFNRLFFYAAIASSTYLISLNSFASDQAITPGVYDQKTHNTLQAYCLEWASDHVACNMLQFFETTKDRTSPISEPIDGNAAAKLALPATAPVKAIDDNYADPKRDPFALTKKAWGDDGPVITASTAGSLLGLGLIAGAGVAVKIPGRPKVTESQDLSENLPDAGALIYNVFVVDEQIHEQEINNTGDVARLWTNFFSHAQAMTPETRIILFTQLFQYTSASDPGLLSALGAPSGSTLVRIEYDPGYTTKQVSSGYQGTHLWTRHYYFVFVPTAEIPEYQQYISSTEAANAKALKIWRKDMYIYFGSVVGATVLVAAAPTIADFFRDLVMYPADAVKKHRFHKANQRIQKENDHILQKWTKIWQNLYDKNINQPVPVSNQMYTALVNAIKTKHPVH